MNTITETVVPSWIAVAFAIATVFLLIAAMLLVLRAKRAAKADPTSAKEHKALRRLFVAAVVAALMVIAAIMAISFLGLMSFAEDDFGFTPATALIVPFTLDGISVTFGFLAFVAVKRGRHPGRAEKIVMAGAAFSAWINYQHGRQEWTSNAGLYLGFLSLASAFLFHELLRQFMDQENLPKARRNGVPVFGERWIWAPWSTLWARRAWIIYPPAPDTEPTVANALEHRQEVKNRKAAAKQGRQAIQPHTRKGKRHSEPLTVPDTSDAATVPASVMVPQHFVPLARSAMQSHVQATGQPITADQLAVRMNISPDVARQLISSVGEPVAPVLNGHVPQAVTR